MTRLFLMSGRRDNTRSAMSAVILNVCKRLTFRRPVLSRHSAVMPAQEASQDLVRRVYMYVADQFDQVDVWMRPRLREANKYFDGDFLAEMTKVRELLDVVAEVLDDCCWERISSGDKPTRFLEDPRVRKIDSGQKYFGQSLERWLESTLWQNVHHLLLCVKLPAYLPHDVLRELLRRVPKAFVESDTLADCLRRLYKPVRLLPGFGQLEDWVHGKLYGNPAFAPDVYYTLARQLVVLPPSLMACVTNEIRCQRDLDRLNHAAWKAYVKARYTRRNAAAKGHRTSRSRSRSRTRAVSDTFDHARRKKARSALKRAEAHTARLVEWYEADATVAEKRAELQRQFIGEHSFGKKLRRGLRAMVGRSTRSTSQQQAQASVERSETRRRRSDPMPDLPRDIQAQEDARAKGHPVSLFDFSMVQIGCAIAGPFHLWHTEWSGTAQHVALTHHLHMLNLLSTLTYIPRHDHDDRFTKHIRPNPLLGRADAPERYKKDSAEWQDSWCQSAYGMRNPLLPRDALLKAKKCMNPATIAKSKKGLDDIYQQLMKDVTRAASAKRAQTSSKGH